MNDIQDEKCQCIGQNFAWNIMVTEQHFNDSVRQTKPFAPDKYLGHLTHMHWTFINPPQRTLFRNIYFIHALLQILNQFIHALNPKSLTVGRFYAFCPSKGLEYTVNTRSQVSSCWICGGQAPVRQALPASIQQSRTTHVSFVFQRRNENLNKRHCSLSFSLGHTFNTCKLHTNC
jgi:hypothetical protein